MSQGELKQIQSNYAEYLQRYPDEGMVQAKLDYPLQSNALVQGGYTGDIESELERELLIYHDNSLPNMELLSIDTLARLPIELMKILKVSVSPDHQEFWKWTLWILKDVNQDIHIFDESLVENVETLVRLTACTPISTPPNGTFQHPRRYIEANWTQEAHKMHTIEESKKIAAFLSFPILEGLIKNVCDDYIEMNGDIKSNKKIRNRNGGYYTKYCYRLGDLLTHLETEYANTSLELKLRDMRIAIGEFYQYNPNKIYNLIEDWRNVSLHGQKTPDAEYGTILNLICLIVWDEIKNRIG